MSMILYNKVKSTFMVDGEIYKRFKILSIERNLDVSALLEEAMREKLDREYPKQYLPQEEKPSGEYVDIPTLLKQFEEHYDIPTLFRKGTLYEIPLPGLEFPITKKGLYQYGEKRLQDTGSKDTLLTFSFLKIPDDKVYDDISMLEEDISRLFDKIPSVVEYKKKHGISEMTRLKINTKGSKTLLDSNTSRYKKTAQQKQIH